MEASKYSTQVCCSCQLQHVVLFANKPLEQVLAAVAASLSFFATGQVRGWASPAVPSLQGLDGLNNSLSYAPLSKESASWISKKSCPDRYWYILRYLFISAASPPIGAIFAALVASVFLQHIGRKWSMILASVMFGFSFAVLGTASIHESYVAILMARAMTGVCVGLSMPAAQIYVS